MSRLADELEKLGCTEALYYYSDVHMTLGNAYVRCQQPHWCMWMLMRLAGQPGFVGKKDLTLWMIHRAMTQLHKFDEHAVIGHALYYAEDVLEGRNKSPKAKAIEILERELTKVSKIESGPHVDMIMIACCCLWLAKDETTSIKSAQHASTAVQSMWWMENEWTRPHIATEIKATFAIGVPPWETAQGNATSKEGPSTTES